MTHSCKKYGFFGLPEQCLRAILVRVSEKVDEVESTHEYATMREDVPKQTCRAGNRNISGGDFSINMLFRGFQYRDH